MKICKDIIAILGNHADIPHVVINVLLGAVQLDVLPSDLQFPFSVSRDPRGKDGGDAASCEITPGAVRVGSGVALLVVELFFLQLIPVLLQAHSSRAANLVFRSRKLGVDLESGRLL